MKRVHSLLIIDDNEFDIEIAEYYLQKSERFEHIFSVSDGDEALELFSDYASARARFPGRFPPLIVLLDINMPRMDGFRFLEEFAKLSNDGQEPAIIVMLTSSAHVHDRERADTFDSVKGYLVKPITVENAIDLAEQFGAED